MKTILRSGLLCGAALILSIGIAAAQSQSTPQNSYGHVPHTQTSPTPNANPESVGGAGVEKGMTGGPISGSYNGTISNGSTNGAGKPRPQGSLPQVMGRETPSPNSGQHPGAQ